MKRCTGCKKEKPFSEFSRDRRGRDGLHPRCRVCKSARAKADYQSNSEPAKQRAARWRKANPEQRRVLALGYYYRHRERMNENSRRWAREHPEQARAAAQAWRKANPERFAESNREARHIRRARERGNHIEPVDRAAIYERDGGICHLCHEPVEPEDFTLDHLVPIALGGPHAPDNVATAHRLCNLRRGTKPIPA